MIDGALLEFGVRLNSQIGLTPAGSDDIDYPLHPISFQHPADRGRRNPQLLSDLCHG